MNSSQISTILKNNNQTKNCFKGVFSANNIKSFNNFPYGIVVNTDRVGEPGTHWVAIYAVDGENAEYFDSYGEEPNLFITNFLNQFNNVNKNKIKIQSIFDISCGPHVIYYLTQKCMGKTLKGIINEISSPYSDSLVKLFVYNLISND